MRWRRLAISTVLGVVTTVGVAWWPIFRQYNNPNGMSRVISRNPGSANPRFPSEQRARMSSFVHDPPFVGHNWLIRRFEFDDCTTIFLRGPQVSFGAADDPLETYTDDEHLFGTLGRELGDLPAEVRLARGEPSPHARGLLADLKFDPDISPREAHLFWVGFGKPWLALSYDKGWKLPREISASAPPQRWQGGWIVSPIGARPWVSGPSPEIVLPLRPIWPGFALNSVVFGIGWFATLSLCVWAWRRVFRRAGCPGCGYDRTGIPAHAPCPECGALAPTTNEPSRASGGSGGAEKAASTAG